MTPQESNNNNNSQLTYTKKIWIAAGIITLIVVFLLLFKTLFSLVLLILAGVLMAIYFYGCAGILQRNLHLSSKLSIILSVLLNIILLVGFFWFVGARLQQQISELSDTLPKTIQQAKDQMNKTALGGKVLEYLNSSGNSQKTKDVVRQFFSSSFGIISDLYIVVLIGLFFTASPSLYKKGMVRLLPAKAKDKGAELINEISEVLKKWLKGQIFGIFFIAVLTGIGLLILGMPLVLTLALIAGLLNFIPNFGPMIALIPAVLLALMQGATTAIIIICMYTGIQIIQSAVTQPIIQKKMISIPPALTIIGQVAMGSLGGFWGVLLATPIVAILMTVIKKLYINK
ncbi:MAG: AI-2E family transporter [Chitinophagaceae bacterium]